MIHAWEEGMFGVAEPWDVEIGEPALGLRSPDGVVEAGNEVRIGLARRRRWFVRIDKQVA